MSFFSNLFGGNNLYSQAANAEKQGLQAGYDQASNNYQQGRNAITTNYAAALQPYTALNATAGQGTTALGNALGLNGTAGNNSALATLQATPGYQFQLGQGLQAVDRGAAARGMVNSGNTMNAENQYAQGLAGQTYNNYVSQLQPYLGLASNAAAGTAGVNMNEGNALNTSFGNQGNLAFDTQAGIGNAQGASDLAQANADNSFLSGALGLGSKLLGYASGGGFSGNPVGGYYGAKAFG